MREDIPGKDNQHIVTGIADGVGTRPKEVKDGVEEHQGDDGEGDADNQVQRDDIAQYGLCRAVIPLPQLDGDESGGSHTYHGSECRSQVHEREGDGEAGDGQWSYALPNENAVHHIIDRGSGHGNDGRDGVLHQQFADGLCT